MLSQALFQRYSMSFEEDVFIEGAKSVLECITKDLVQSTMEKETKGDPRDEKRDQDGAREMHPRRREQIEEKGTARSSTFIFFQSLLTCLHVYLLSYGTFDIALLLLSLAAVIHLTVLSPLYVGLVTWFAWTGLAQQSRGIVFHGETREKESQAHESPWWKRRNASHQNSSLREPFLSREGSGSRAEPSLSSSSSSSSSVSVEKLKCLPIIIVTVAVAITVEYASALGPWPSANIVRLWKNAQAWTDKVRH